MTERETVIQKLIKIKKLKESEEKIGNVDAAENFAAMINRMLIEHDLEASDIEHARLEEAEPITTIEFNEGEFGIKHKFTRVAWQEMLAQVVAKNTMCRILVASNSSSIWFVGTESHARVAEFLFGTLLSAAIEMAARELRVYRYECWKRGDVSAAHGFRSSWLNAFVIRIHERLTVERKRVVYEQGDSVKQCDALVRLDQSLARVDAHIAELGNKKKARGLRPKEGYNHEGAKRGREAADRIPINDGVYAGAQRKIRGGDQ